MLSTPKEHELLEALQTAESRSDSSEIKGAVTGLALFYMTTGQFSIAATFWRRGAELLATRTAADSAELATYLHNMAALCLMPGGMRSEAHDTLMRARELYQHHFNSDAPCLKDVEELLDETAA